MANHLLSAAGLTLKEAQERIDEHSKPFSFELEGVKLDLDARVTEVGKARNVMALLEEV